MDDVLEIKAIRNIARGIAVQLVINKSTESRAERKRLAENMNVPWKEYVELEKKILKHYCGESVEDNQRRKEQEES